jgi:hypothetical protein
MRGRKPFYKRALFWVPVSLVLFVAILAIIASPLASFATKKAIEQIDGYDGEFESAGFNLFTLTYTLRGLNLYESPEELNTKIVQKEPVVYVETVHAGLMVSQLFRLNLVARAHVNGAKMTYVLLPRPKPKKPEPDVEPKKKTPQISEIDEVLQDIIPFKLGRVDVQNTELLIVDGNEKSRPQIWISDIEMAIENVTNRRRLDEGWPAVFAMSATVQKSGKLTVFVTADPLSEMIRFAGRAELKGLKLKDLHAFVAAKAGLSIPEGTFDLYTSFKSEKGMITGGVKPMLTDVKIEAADENLGRNLIAKLADASLNLLADDPRKRDVVAAQLPIRGKLTDPQPQLVPTVITLLRNAFVEGLDAGFSTLPMPTAEEKEGVLEQAVKGLRPDKTPKAQPVADKDDEKKKKKSKRQN